MGVKKLSIAEVKDLPEAEKLMRCRERLAEFHAECYDWKAVLADKWALLRLAQERGN